MRGLEITVPRRQAMLRVVKDYGGVCTSTKCVPVFVWPMPTTEGLFVVEHQNGTVQRVQPDSLTFLGSKELFDQYDWSADEA